MLSKNKINDIWHSGFCKVTVEFAKTTEPHESRKRVEFLIEHVKKCKGCYYANILKILESEVATMIGTEYKSMFDRGMDISKYSKFNKCFRIVMDRAMRNGLIDNDMKVWMFHKSLRRDYETEKDNIQ